MSVNNDVVFFGGNRPTPLDRVAQAFSEICSHADIPSVDGRAIGHGLPCRRVGVRELVELLPLLSADARDAVWRELIRLSRERGEPWSTIALGIALPGLRTAAARLSRQYSGDTDDLDAELVAAFYEALTNADIHGPLVCARLRAIAFNQVRRMRYDAVSYAARATDLDAFPELAAPTPCGHPDFVLADAVRAGVITRQEAELVGASRLDGTSLSTVAKNLGIAVTTAWCRRKSAEIRLSAWIKGRQSLS